MSQAKFPGALRAELDHIKVLLGTDRVAAHEHALALVDQWPHALEARLLLAAACSYLQDYAAAVDVLHGCWVSHPRADIAFNYGYCLRQTGDYRSALHAFLAGLALAEDTGLRALAADTAAVLGEVTFARELLGAASDPLLAFRRRALGGAQGTALASDAARDRAVLFWMKYDCHLYNELDNKQTLARLMPDDARYWPQSFPLPDNDGRAARGIATSGTAMWIAKPAAESGGRGMTLLRGPRPVLPQMNGVVQRYVDPPFLYAGRKCNLRLLLSLAAPRPAATALWKSALVYFATAPYVAGEGDAGAAAVANLLRSDRAMLARPLGDLPAHVVPLEQLLAVSAAFDGLGQALARLARDLVASLESSGFLARVRALSDAFMPRFIGLDVGLDASGRPWLFEIERYPGLGGVSPLSAAINTRFRRDWMRYVLAGQPGDDPDFVSLVG